MIAPSLSDNLYDDDDVFASPGYRETEPNRDHIADGGFVAFAHAIARQAYSAAALANDCETVWAYDDGSWSVGEKPLREYVAAAPGFYDYPHVEALWSRLIIGARRCAKCNRAIAEHSAEYRFFGVKACGEYDAGFAMAVSA